MPLRAALFLALFPLGLLAAGAHDLATNGPQPALATGLPGVAPLTGITAGSCDFGRIARDTFRCGVGAAIVVEMRDGQRVLVPGPVLVTFGKIGG